MDKISNQKSAWFGPANGLSKEKENKLNSLSML